MLAKFIFNRVKEYCEKHKLTKEQLLEIRDRNFIKNLTKSQDRSYFLVLMPFFIGALIYLVIYSAFSFITGASTGEGEWVAYENAVNIGSMVLGGAIWFYASKLFRASCDTCAQTLK